MNFQLITNQFLPSSDLSTVHKSVHSSEEKDDDAQIKHSSDNHDEDNDHHHVAAQKSQIKQN